MKTADGTRAAMTAFDPSATTRHPELARTFEQQGFVAYPQFLSARKMVELLSHLGRFIDQIVPQLPAEQVFYEDKQNPASLKQIQQLGVHDPWFRDLFFNGCFRELAEFLLKGPVVPKNMQYFNKPPAIGRPTPPHQDGYYFMISPCEAVTMWLALDDVDEENGCVRYVRESHKRGLRPHQRTQTLGFSQGIDDYPLDEDRAGEVAVPARPGDLLVHHAMTIHRADGNQSPTRSRRALGLIYYSERAREDTAAHTDYQRKLADEMRALKQI